MGANGLPGVSLIRGSAPAGRSAGHPERMMARLRANSAPVWCR